MKKKIQKPFDAQAAKNGAKVETREGRSVRIVCYDRAVTDYSIVALVDYQLAGESCNTYTTKGELVKEGTNEEDLVIVEEAEVTKFNVGDWLIAADAKYGDKYPWLITKITSDCYELQDLQAYKVKSYHKTIDNHYRLWTLEDAKPGDILVREDGKYPIILQRFLGSAIFAYCGLNIMDSVLIDDGKPWTNDPVRPATYKERQQLFNKLEEEGYKWDAKTLTLWKKM